jgi:hypothetical protein
VSGDWNRASIVLPSEGGTVSAELVPRGIARAAGAADGDHGSGALAANFIRVGLSARHRRHFMSGPSRAGRGRMSKPRLASWLGEVKDGTGQLDGGPGESGLRVPEGAEREHRLALPVRGRLPGCGSAQGLVAACPAAGDGRRVCGERPMWPRAPSQRRRPLRSRVRTNSSDGQFPLGIRTRVTELTCCEARRRAASIAAVRNGPSRVTSAPLQDHPGSARG